MLSTKPQDVSQALHFISHGLSMKLITKKEVIDWADKIIISDEEPDIFFIELSLLGSKMGNEISNHINSFINYENLVIIIRPYLGLVYKSLLGKKLSLEDTMSLLYEIRYDNVLPEAAQKYAEQLGYEYEEAVDNIYGSVAAVHKDVEDFLSIYKSYTLYNVAIWPELDELADRQTEENYKLTYEKVNAVEVVIAIPGKKKWWKVW